MSDFKLNFLDHVAIRVVNLEQSANWYESVLGLKRYQLEKWGEFPIFMLTGKSGVALFPNDPNSSLATRVDHFAFNVSKRDFEKAKVKFDTLGISYQEQDHFYFHSIYLRDPDNHIVELTTLIVPEKEFYQK